MNDAQGKVEQFHRAMDMPVGDGPRCLDDDRQQLRIDLIREEVDELDEALSQYDLAGTADALADLLYVTYGAAVEAGIDIEPIFAEVHRSNMTKVGGPKDANGKQLKPESYKPPQIKQLLELQNPRYESD